LSVSRRHFLRVGSAGAAGLWLGIGCSAWDPVQEVSEEAHALHRECLVFDLHVDTLLWTRVLGYDLARSHRNRIPTQPFGFHMDLPRARAGGLDAAVLGLVINPREVRDELILPLKLLARLEGESGAAQVRTTLRLLAENAAAHPDRLQFARTGSELRFGVETGRFAALAGLEGSQGIEGDLANLQSAYEDGLRMLGLVHFQATEAGKPMTVSAYDGEGLTDFGRELVRELERLGVVVDLAHLNAAGLEDAFELMRRPFVVSHSACRALQDHPRNLDDAQLARIADRGGVIGIAFGRSFIGGPGDIEALLDHVEHALDKAGSEAVALGSDYDGFIVPVSGLGDVRSYPLITQGLLHRGVHPDVIRKLMGENALRVVTEVCG